MQDDLWDVAAQDDATAVAENFMWHLRSTVDAEKAPQVRGARRRLPARVHFLLSWGACAALLPAALCAVAALLAARRFGVCVGAAWPRRARCWPSVVACLMWVNVQPRM
jgi:hypothetical protein